MFVRKFGMFKNLVEYFFILFHTCPFADFREVWMDHFITRNDAPKGKARNGNFILNRQRG